MNLVVVLEGSVSLAKSLQQRLADVSIPSELSAPPAKACSGGGCGCGAKLQVLVQPDDVSRVATVLQSDWLEAVKCEGLGGESFVQLKTPTADGTLPCPACGFAGALVNGACGDCGLQLE
jgi:hypothetical protein